MSQTTVDPKEVSNFAAIAESWWDPDGDFAPLHALNPARLRYVRDQIKRRLKIRTSGPRPFQGLRVLDLGCGGGLISEPLARLGARVVGVDATADNIAVARAHAAEMELEIDYRATTGEALAAEGARFDAVVALEIVEHVADLPLFLKSCRTLVRPGGVVVLSTLNRTAKSYLTAILGAEYLLRWLPRGTHDWQKFIKPDELESLLAAADLRTVDVTGLSFDPVSRSWRSGKDTSVNYMLTALAS